jgi:hypothetical protein
VVHDVAGLSQIDHIITTHWHLDHYGAIGLLADRLRLMKFYDRGIPADVPEDPKNYPRLITAYKKACGNQSITLRAGDEIPLKRGAGPALRFQCLMADGKVGGSGPDQRSPNPYCDRHVEKEPDPTDNGKSLVMLLSFGRFDFFNPGDLTWNFEKMLACPVNRAGQVELCQVSHHGLAQSSNPVLVHALHPMVAVMCNGPRKGGHPDVVRTYRQSPGLLDLWQLHRNAAADESQNAPRHRVANWDSPAGGQFILARADPSGEWFTVRIGTDGTPVRYACWK